MEPMYDRNGEKIEVGDQLFDTRDRRVLRVHTIRQSVWLSNATVIMCHDIYGYDAIYRGDLPYVEVMIPDDPRDFKKVLPV